MTTQAKDWFTSTRLGVITLILNIICIVYLTIIKDNTTYNKVQQHDKELIEVRTTLKFLQDNKVDKETIQLFYNQNSEIRSDIKEVRNLLIQHINK